MQDNKGDLTKERNNRRMSKIVTERDPTPLGDNAVSLGKKVVYYLIGSER